MTDPIFVDVYPGDGHKDWNAYIAAGQPFCGAIFKASQGTRYRYDAWLHAERSKFCDAAERTDRYGITAFDGMYHYLTFDEDGAAQAEYFMKSVEQSGGEGLGTLWAMVDVERGGQVNQNPSRALVEDRVRSFAARYHALTGRLPTLYGGELLRSLGVTDRLGCGRSAVALYGSRMGSGTEPTAAFLARTGTDLAHLMLWQYVAAEGAPSGPAGYPREAPGCGRVDMSALTIPGGLATLSATLWL